MFAVWAEKFILRSKYLSRPLKTALCVYWSLFSIFYSVFWGFWRNQILSETVLVWLAKASFYHFWVLFDDICFILKKPFLSHFHALWAKGFSNIGLQSFGSVLEFAKQVFGRKIWKKNFSTKIRFHLFCEYRQKVSRLPTNLFDMHFTKLIFHFWSKILESKLFAKKEFIDFFRTLSGRISHFGRNCWDSFLKIAF